MLAACAGIGRVPPVAVDTLAGPMRESGNYAALVQSRQWVLTTTPGPYNCGPLGVYVDANGAYQDAMRAVLRNALERVTFVSAVLTPEDLKAQGFDAQIVVSQGNADASLIGTPTPGKTARSDVSLMVTVAVRDQRGALAQKTVSGYGRGKGEGVDCRQIVAAVGEAAQAAIATIARHSATYITGAISDRRIAKAAPVPPPAPPAPPPKPAAKPTETAKRETARETVQDTLRDAIAGGAAAAQVLSSGADGEKDAEADRAAKRVGSIEHAPPAVRAGATVTAGTSAPGTSAGSQAQIMNDVTKPPHQGALIARATAEQAHEIPVASDSSDEARPSGEVLSDTPTPSVDAVPAEKVPASDPPPSLNTSPPPDNKIPPSGNASGTRKAETVALSTAPRAALPRATEGPISAEEAFARGAAAAAGRGTPKNDAEAMKWYRVAAARGYAPAENNLGFMYAEGRGVPRNDSEAVKWYKRAAARKYPPAETSLGMMYAAGRGVDQSDFEALSLYSSAANQGYGQAKANLAAMYGEGRGVQRDVMTATFLLGSVRERPYTGSGVYVEPQTAPEYKGQ